KQQRRVEVCARSLPQPRGKRAEWKRRALRSKALRQHLQTGEPIDAFPRELGAGLGTKIAESGDPSRRRGKRRLTRRAAIMGAPILQDGTDEGSSGQVELHWPSDGGA